MTNEQRHLEFTLQYYKVCKGHAPGTLRSAYGDAAHMCDAVAKDIVTEHTVRGRVTRKGLARAAAVKRAGDAIWAMREKVAP